MRALAFGLGLVALAVAVPVMFNTPYPVQAQAEFAITGRIVNGTAGAGLSEEIAVLMLVTGPDGSLAGTGQTGVDREGRFRFEGLELEENSNITVSVDYGGVFSSVTFTPNDRPQDLTLTVFEPTGDASVIQVGQQIMVLTGVDSSDRSVRAIEFVRLNNPTDRTLIPDVANTAQISFLRFALPPGATNLAVESDLPSGDVISIGTGFALTSPVMPGTHSINFSYTFPYEGDAVAYRQSLVQGAELFQLLVPETVSGVNVAGLEAIDMIQIEENSYQAWEQRDIPPGQGLGLSISGLPQPGVWVRLGNSVTDGDFWQVTIPSALGATLAGLLLWGAIGRQHGPAHDVLANSAAQDASSMQTSNDRARLVRSVAALDDRYDRGGLGEAEYAAERARLVELILEGGQS